MLGNITSDQNGTFSFNLSTNTLNNADEGIYFVTTTANPSATNSFVLDSSEPTRPLEDSRPIIGVPAGIAFKEQVFLPVIIKY